MFLFSSFFTSLFLRTILRRLNDALIRVHWATQLNLDLREVDSQIKKNELDICRHTKDKNED